MHTSKLFGSVLMSLFLSSGVFGDDGTVIRSHDMMGTAHHTLKAFGNRSITVKNLSASLDHGHLVLKADGHFAKGAHIGFFIDSDNNPATGYTRGVIKGADYVVQSNGLYRYPKGAHGWHWDKVKNVKVRYDQKIASATFGVPLSSLENLKDAIKFIVEISTADWKKHYSYDRMVAFHVNRSYVYVDANRGDDANSGTQNEPFKTIQKAISLAKPGDTIYVKAGEYYENIKITHSGTKGKPITITAQKGARLYGVKPLNANWQKIGQYSYKTTDIPYEPFSMMVKIDGKLRHIPRLRWHWIDNQKSPGTTEEVLNYPPEGTTPLQYFDSTGMLNPEQKRRVLNDIKMQYWDGIEAVYTYDTNTKTTYIRFRNGDDPEQFELFGTSGEVNHFGKIDESRFTDPLSETAAIDIDNSSYITIRGLKIYSAQNGVLIHGKNASHNIVENNEILNGQRRVSLARLAHDNFIRNNILHTHLIDADYRPMAWWDWWRAVKNDNIDIDAQKRRAVAEHIYEVYKHEVGASTFSPMDSCGVFVDTAGENNTISGNEIYDLLGGVLGNYKGALYVHDNYFHHIGSVATGPAIFTNPCYIYKNRFEDVHFAYRVQLNFKNHLDQYKQEGYFFNNIVKNPKDIGSHFMLYSVRESAAPDDSQLPKIYIYHNTFIGSGPDNQGLFYHTGKNLYIVNNIFLDTSLRTYGGDIGLFAYNWVNLVDGVNTKEAEKNGNVIGTNLWNTDHIDLKHFSPSMLKIPSGSDAHEGGIDLSKSFTVEGRRAKPFPFMKNGYFNGNRPDMGIVW